MNRDHLWLFTKFSFILVGACAVMADDFIFPLMLYINLLWMWCVVGFYVLTNRGKDE